MWKIFASRKGWFAFTGNAVCARIFLFSLSCVAHANVKERLIVARAYIQRTLFSCARSSCLLCVCFPICFFQRWETYQKKKKQVCFSIRRGRIVNVLISFWQFLKSGQTILEESLAKLKNSQSLGLYETSYLTASWSLHTNVQLFF